MTIFYGDKKDGFINALSLICICGHKLSEHSFYPIESTKTIATSQCVLCGLTEDKQDFICKQFKAGDEN